MGDPFPSSAIAHLFAESGLIVKARLAGDTYHLELLFPESEASRQAASPTPSV